mgnify:CR=1 FL=1
MTIVFKRAFTSQSLSIKSTANQSINSGWVGKAPCTPKSWGVLTRPFPKSICQYRFTVTLAVNGLSSEKSHFDFEKNVWTIPPENHKLGKKSGKPLRRPITPEIKGYLQQAFELSSGSKYVFTNFEKNEVMGHTAPLQIPYNIMQFLRRRKQFELPHFSMHDLRRTCRSNLSSLTTFNLAEVMLGHSRGIASVYDQHDYLEEQAEAYSAWCKRLNSLVDGEPPAAPSKNNVIRLDRWQRA